MHNVLSAAGLATVRTAKDGKQTWAKRENQVAEARANLEKPEQYNVQNAVVWCQPIRPRSTPSVYRRSILNWHVNFDNRAAIFRPAE
jgi:hypothetical protein